MNRSEIALLLAAIQSGDRRTVGEADVELWLQVAGDVPLDFARQAVVAHFRERPGVWLEPGHIVSRWRDFRRDQLAREADEMREARQAVLDARNVAELGVDALAESKVIPAPRYFRRSQEGQPNPLTVACPWCKATVGRPCVNNATGQHTNPHPSRVEAVTTTKEESNA